MRTFLIEQFYKIAKIPYTHIFKNKHPWPLKISDLTAYPSTSLGYSLGNFLETNNFDLQPSLEDHDVFHVLTEIGSSVKNEIELQFYLFGNGKRSLFLLLVLLVGLVFYPFDCRSFFDYYKKGKAAHRFFDVPFLKILRLPIAQIRFTFNIQL